MKNDSFKKVLDVKKNILVNAFGIRDSGGLNILRKTLNELKNEINYEFYIFTFESSYLSNMLNEYYNYNHFHFHKITNKNIIFRLYYENLYFPFFCKKNCISVIYNLTGTSQFLSKIPILVKIQNLLFFSKKLDSIYIKNKKWLLWLKQVWIKRLIFSIMLRHSRCLEIQSGHVKDELSNFININNKCFYIKNDIHIPSKKTYPKNYKLKKPIVFLFISGPHFYLPHKNLNDFVISMLNLKELGIDFSINITVSYKELSESGLWNDNLNELTNFLGYIEDSKKIIDLYSENSILISTSVIETLGLHVIDAIMHGSLCIVPNENYSKYVYGDDLPKYKLFDPESLTAEILKLTSLNNFECQSIIEKSQRYISDSANLKHSSTMSILNNVITQEN